MTRGATRSTGAGLTYLLALVLFAAASVVVFMPVVRGSRTFFALPDNMEQSYAWMSKLVRSWRGGEVPLWDFSTFSGTSFIGELQTAPLYPPHLAFALFGPAVSQEALDRYVVAHFVAALFLLFVFLHQNRIGPLAAGAGATVGCAVGTFGVRAGQQWNLFFGLVWIPATLVLAQRALAARGWRSRLGWSCGSAAALGLSFLAGHPAPAIFSIVALVVLPPAPGGVLKGVWWHRPLVVALVLAVAGLLTAPQLLPTVEYMERAYRWVGAPTPVLGWARPPYAVYAFVEVLKPGQLWDAVRPVGDLADGGSLFVTVTGLALAVIGALVRERIARFGLALVVAGLLISLGGHTPLGPVFYRLPPISIVREPIRALHLYQLGMSVLAASGAGFVMRHARRVNDRLAPTAGVVILACIGAEVLSHAEQMTLPGNVANAAARRYAESTVATFLVRHLEEGPHRYRVLSFDSAALPPNLGDAVIGIQTTLGHRATMYRPYFDYLCRDWSPTSSNYDRLAVRYVASLRDLASLPLVLRDGEVRIYERPNALPIFQLERGDGSLVAAPLTAAHWSEGAVELALEAGTEGRLVMAQASYPGWVATVDGHRRDLETADIFLAVPLKPGDRVVRLAYRPLSFRVGVAGTLLTLLGLGIGGGGFLRGDRNRRADADVGNPTGAGANA